MGGNGAMQGYVVVSERPAATVAGRHSGLFDADWDTGEDVVEGPRGADVGVAIRWARQRADIVYVHVGGGEDGVYSAGATRVTDAGVKQWPPEGMTVRARPEGTPVDGRLQAGRWRIALGLPGVQVQSVDALRRALERAPQASRVRVDGDGTLHLEVVARGLEDAGAKLHEVLDTGVREAGIAESVEAADLEFGGIVVVRQDG